MFIISLKYVLNPQRTLVTGNFFLRDFNMGNCNVGSHKALCKQMFKQIEIRGAFDLYISWNLLTRVLNMPL